MRLLLVLALAVSAACATPLVPYRPVGATLHTWPPVTVGRMEGTVVLYPDSSPVPGVIIQAFRDPNGAPVARTTSDENGNFRLRLGRGTYVVRAYATSFREIEITVTNSGVGKPDLTITMLLGI